MHPQTLGFASRMVLLGRHETASFRQAGHQSFRPASLSLSLPIADAGRDSGLIKQSGFPLDTGSPLNQ